MIAIKSQAEYISTFNLSGQLFAKGSLTEAYNGYEKLLTYWLASNKNEDNLPFTMNESSMVDRLIDLSLLFGKKETAISYLQALACKPGLQENAGIQINVVTKLILVYVSDGLIDKAIDELQELAGIIGDVDSIEISNAGLIDWENAIRFDDDAEAQYQADQMVCLYDALGYLKIASGKFTDASLLLQRGIQVGEANPSPVVLSRLLPMKINLCKAYFEKGELELAKDELTDLETEAAGQQVSSGNQIQLLDLQSRIALAQGEMGNAYELLTQIITLSRNYGLLLPDMHASFNLAQTKVLLNQVADATEILMECKSKAEAMGDYGMINRVDQFLKVADKRVSATMPALNYAASKKIRTEDNDYDDTREEDTVNISRPEDYVTWFEENALLFQVYLTESKVGKAKEMLLHLREIVNNSDSSFLEVRLRVLEFSLLYYTNGTIDKGFPFPRLLGFLKGNQLLPELWQFRNMLVKTDLVPASEKGVWLAENQQLLNQITSSLPPEMQTLYLLNKWSYEEEHLSAYADKLFELCQEIEAIKLAPWQWFRRQSYSRLLLAFKDETNRYQDYLSRSVITGNTKGKFNLFVKKVALSITKLWKQPKDTLTLFFLVLPDRIVTISISYRKVRFHTNSVSRVFLRQLVFNIRDQLYPEGRIRGVKGMTDIKPAAPPLELSQLLPVLEDFLQFNKILHQHKRNFKAIKIIADDVLHGLPFTMLTIGGSFIIEKYRVSVSVTNDELNGIKSNRAERKALVTGVWNYPEGINNLPGVEREIAQVKETMQQNGLSVTVVTNERATVDEIRKQMADYQVVHFSCHGTFNFRRPAESGLLLANGNILSLQEILSEHDLSNIELMVLSSCRGAEHYILPGRWIIGLPETFCRAGVRCVVAFLWPVHDDFATAFTTTFYSYYKKEAPSEAFRLTIMDAKNKKLSLTNIEYWQPAFWAGAILYER